jgi:hypothetical protein
VPSSRSLRRLVPDQALLERRAAGESLRVLAGDYGVAHSTLLRYLRRPNVVLELREARRRLPERRKQARAKCARVRRLEQEVRRRAREEAKRDRALDDWTPPQRSSSDPYLALLDHHDAPQGYISRELYSPNDRKAERAVAAGGGVEQVIKTTGLRSRENALRNIDPQIMLRALHNDARRSKIGPPDIEGLRRLAPDLDLLSRRASGEPLRQLASDYGVSHTSLSRYFRRPEVAKNLHRQRSTSRANGRPAPPPRHQSHARILAKVTAEIRREIGKIVCSVHHRRPTVRSEPAPSGKAGLAVTSCCARVRKEIERRVTELDAGRAELSVAIDRELSASSRCRKL